VRQQRGGEALGGAEGDLDLAAGVDLQAVVAPLVRRDRLAQRRDPGQRGVLVVPLVERGGRRVEDGRRTVLVREALTEIDRPGALGEVGYLGEDCGAD
jgi:hypothetical protein